jgi:S-adenosylmethionine:tRNA ribosyltransferase-isomerase
MKTRIFSFNVPEELIAQYPAAKGKSRLLIVNRKDRGFEDDEFAAIPARLPAGSVLVLNNSKVRKARFVALSETGGEVEFILLSQRGPRLWDVLVSRSKRQKIGRKYSFPGGVMGEIAEGTGAVKGLRFSRDVSEDYVERYGTMPLPPYIKRDADTGDDKSYQTVYAETPGSAAAPTAGLHFTEELLRAVAEKGVRVVYVTLHVGIGTFLPIRTKSIYDHQMHEETYAVAPAEAKILTLAKKEGRPIIAVGTTTVRTLESAFLGGEFRSGSASTNLYIYPGYQFRAVDGIITNFHTPESSLFVMISAFAGTDLLKQAYSHGVERKYRFFSYGDAMYLPPV